MRKKLFYIIAIIVALVFMVSSVFAIINKPEEVKAEGAYKTIQEVDGIAFQANSSIVNSATAISQISDKIQIDPDLYYVYKDKETYLLFNVNKLVIAAQKGTSFHFDQYENKEEAVPNSSVAGLWFEVNGSKFKYEDKTPFIANVNAGLVVTNDIYNDFVGQLSVISDGTTEWSLFVGVPGTNKFKNLPDETQKSISAIVNSITFSSTSAIPEEEEYAVNINTGEKEEVKAEESTASEVAEREVPTPTPVEETAPSDETENAIEVTEVTSSPCTDPLEEVTEEPVEKTPVPTEEKDAIEIVEAEPTEEPALEETPIPTVEPTTNRPVKGEVLNLNNQKKKLNKTTDKAYTSDIYSMLELKDNGIITEYDIESGTSVNPIINVQNIYTGQDAYNMVKAFCDKDATYNYFDAQAGCTWHVAEYYLSFKDCPVTPYINIKLKGMDGNPLKYKGITYSKRTYDMLSEVKEEGAFKGPYYCYYAVPNGCSEYVLECGTGNIDIVNSLNQAAYYRIQN